MLQAHSADPRGLEQGGVSVELMESARRVIQQRTRGLHGVLEPLVEIKDGDKLVVELPGVKDADSAARLLSSSGTLEFYYLKDVQNANNPMGRWRMEPAMTEDKGYLFTDTRGQIIDSIKQPVEVLAKVVRSSENKPILSGQDLLPNAKANLNRRNQTVINIEFNREGTGIFREFTRTHVGDYLAVFFDGRLITAPSINEAIPSGKAEITGFRSLAEARRTAEVINSGGLPVGLKVISKERL